MRCWYQRQERNPYLFLYPLGQKILKEFSGIRITYVFGDERRVSVSFEAISSEQTRVTQVFDSETENPEQLQRGGWQAILENGKKHTETL